MVNGSPVCLASGCRAKASSYFCSQHGEGCLVSVRNEPLPRKVEATFVYFFFEICSTSFQTDTFFTTDIHTCNVMVMFFKKSYTTICDIAVFFIL